MVNWGANEAERLLFAEIAKNVCDDLRLDVLSIMMALEACHCNGCPLDLEGLKAAGKADAIHDVAGIVVNVNRNEGHLENHFVPRFAAKGVA